MTFTPAAAGDSITRDAGSWLADGFRAGETIRLAGTGANDGVYTIAQITAARLTFTSANKLLTGTATAAPATVVATAEPDVDSVFTNLPPDKIPLVLKDAAGNVVSGGTPVLAKDVVAALEQTGVKLASLAGQALDVAQLVLSQSTSRIVIGGNAKVIASQNVVISATALSDVTLKAPSIPIPLVNGIGSPFAAAMGSSNATATAVVQSGASITAGAVFNLSTNVTNNLDVTVSSPAGIVTGTEVATAAGALKSPIRIPAPALSIAAGHADSESESGLAAGSTVNAGAVYATATNADTFKVAAASTVVSPKTNFGDAAGVAVSDFASHALVHLDGTVTTVIGDVQAHARSVNSTDTTNSTALVTGAPFASPALNAITGLLLAPGVDPVEGPGTSQFGMAAAVAIAVSTNNADAHVGDNARVTAAGNLAVTSYAEDDLKAGASGSSFSTTTPTSPGSRVSLGGAFILGAYSNNANADVGKSAVVVAQQGVTVDAQAVVPPHLPFASDAQGALDFFRGLETLADQSKPSIDGSSPGAFASSLVGATKFATDATGGVLVGAAQAISPLADFLNGTLGIDGLATTYAISSAAAKTQDGNGLFAFSGTVDLLHVGNHATAYLDEGAHVTTSNGKSVSVTSSATVETIDVAGKGSLVSLVTSKGAAGGRQRRRRPRHQLRRRLPRQQAPTPPSRTASSCSRPAT